MAMNRKDMVPFLVLLTLLLAWPVIDRIVILKHVYGGKAPAAETQPAQAPEPDAPAVVEEAALVAASDAPAAPVDAGTPEKAASAPAAVVEAVTEEPADTVPERTIELANDVLRVVFSSRGASLQKATLLAYPRVLGSSEPVVLDSSYRPGLVYEGIPGIGAAQDFNETRGPDGELVLERRSANGLVLRRTVRLDDRYVLRISDRLVNEGPQAVSIPAHSLRTGVMQDDAPHHRGGKAGMVFLGVDTLSPGGEKVQHWGGKIAKLFERELEEGGLATLPRSIDISPRELPVDWVAAKNKYFAQILTPGGGAEDSRIYAVRVPGEREAANPSAVQTKMTAVQEVAAAAVFAAQDLAPGDAIEREMTYYVGPKKFSELHAMAYHQVDVMEFGDWIKPISKLLLRVLNFLYDHVPPHSYGLAIILLTIIVKIVFWPVTHKSTESMKRMAQVAPLVNAIREKFKDNPQKQQQEIMALYKEHKINPLGGCLPMLIQIPVFFALFTVLRSAIELRFASFLWIADLSEPENLFAGMIPFVGSLNLLPLFMAFTMWLQMKLSPSAGDPAQQKIMSVMMPGMMLVFLYNFASGLALYWTTQNILMIVQQMLMKRKNPPVAVPAKA